MKNKKLNTLLGPFVILVWIGVLFRFVGGCEEGLGKSDLADASAIAKAHITAWDSFSLELDYRDPFLNQLPIPPKKIHKTAKRSVGKLIQKPPQKKIIIPKLSYQGGVASGDSLAMTGILLVGGQVRAVRAGEQIGNIRIESLGLDRLSLSIEDSLITLYR